MHEFVEKLRGRPHLVLSACCLALVLVMASVTSVNLALEDIAVSLNASGTDLTWVADAYTVALAALVLTFGAFGDDFGRRRALVLGTLVFGVAAGVAATTGSVSMLIVWRAVMGIGAAMIMPSTLSTVTAVFPRDQRAKAVAIWAGFASAGAVIGLLMSGALLEYYGWESTFVAIAILAAISLLATLLCVPDTRNSEQAHPDLLGSALTALGIGGLVYGIIEGSDKGWGQTAPVLAFAIAAVSLLLWVLHDRRIAWPMLDPRLFRLRGLSSGALTLVLLFLGAFGFFYVGLQYVQLVLGYGPFLAALSFLPIAAVVIPLSALTPAIGERVGDKAIMAGGLALMGASLVLMTRLNVGSGYVPFLLAMLVFAAGLALSSTPSTNVVIASLPAAKQGVASALNDVTREFGAALGIALMGSLFNAGYASSVAPATARLRLPEATSKLIEDSAAVGLHVAKSPKLGRAGAVLEQQVKEAFMSGMHRAFVAGAIVLGVGIAYVLVRAPGRGDVPEGETEDKLTAKPASVVRRDEVVPAYSPVGGPLLGLRAHVVGMARVVKEHAPPRPAARARLRRQGTG